MSGAAVTRLVVLAPLLAAVAGLLLSRGNRSRAAVIGVGGALLTLLASLGELAALHGSAAHPSIGFLGGGDVGAFDIHLDLRASPYAALVAVTVSVVALCVQLYSTGYLAADTRYPAYAAEVSLFTAAMLVVVQADDLFLLLIGWEVMGLCSYLLVGHDSERLAARRAAVKAFLVTRFGDVGFTLGIIVIVAATRTSSIHGLLDPATRPQVASWVWPLAFTLLVVGVAGKSAQFPLHTWLPDAMEGPTPVSALIHAATMVAAGVFVLGELFPVLAAETVVPRDILAAVACVSMLGAALAAFGQSDLKRLLAYSTISQVAYMLAAIAIAPTVTGAGPATAHLVAHAGFKALLFLSAGCFAYLAGTTELAGLSGGWRRSPLVASCFTVGLAALAGLPPLSGFWSKEAVLSAAEEQMHRGDVRVAGLAVFLVGLATAVVTAAYATRAFLLVVLPVRPVVAPHADEELVAEPPVDLEDAVAAPHDHRRLPDAMRWPLVVLAAWTLLGGLLQLTSALPGRVHLSFASLFLSPVLVVVTILVLARVSRTAPDGDPLGHLPARLQVLLHNGFGLDDVQHALVVRPTRALARLVVRGDEDVVDAYPRATASLTAWGGRAVRRAQSGLASSYLLWLVGGVLVAGVVGVSTR